MKKSLSIIYDNDLWTTVEDLKNAWIQELY